MIARTKLSILLLFLPLLLLSAWVAAEETHEHERESCKVCGMWIDEYQKSAAELVYKDGTTIHTCGVACMLRVVDDEGGISAFKSVKVHDWVTGKLVDAETATYVLGSKVIPDMIPNYIAFAKREEAEAFAAKQGGEVIDYNFAYQDISPVGTTSPFRLRTAVTPPAGTFSVGMVYGYMEKDQVARGSTSTQDPNQFIQGNPAQPKTPNRVQNMQQALVGNYSLTDRLAMFINVPWYERRLSTLNQTTTPAGSTFDKTISNENGIGNITIEGRYNFWRSTRNDKFATVLLGTTLPTGQFDATRAPVDPTKAPTDPGSGQKQLTPQVITAPAQQLGTDVTTFKGGLVYSERWKDFWLHASALYTVNPKNSDNYAFGDVAEAGLGLHYTPNYNTMVGVEIDAAYAEKNIDNGVKVGNTGGTTVNLAVVSDYRFMNAFGGNFKLRTSVGTPIYQDLNYKEMLNPKGQSFEQVQLGGGFFANVSVVWTKRPGPEM
jgi:nitrous oxide reductase accessory protein NosL